MRIESFSPTQITIAPASLTGKRGRFPYNSIKKIWDTLKSALYSIQLCTVYRALADVAASYVFNHRFFYIDRKKIAIFA